MSRNSLLVGATLAAALLIGMGLGGIREVGILPPAQADAAFVDPRQPRPVEGWPVIVHLPPNVKLVGITNGDPERHTAEQPPMLTRPMTPDESPITYTVLMRSQSSVDRKVYTTVETTRIVESRE